MRWHLCQCQRSCVRMSARRLLAVLRLRFRRLRLLDRQVVEGCALGRDGQWHEHGSVELPPDYIKGAAGAGDAFTAGVLLGWHEGLPVGEWLRMGICAAAANLWDETCTKGLRPLAECLALGKKYGFRG